MSLKTLLANTLEQAGKPKLFEELATSVGRMPKGATSEEIFSALKKQDSALGIQLRGTYRSFIEGAEKSGATLAEAQQEFLRNLPSELRKDFPSQKKTLAALEPTPKVDINQARAAKDDLGRIDPVVQDPRAAEAEVDRLARLHPDRTAVGGGNEPPRNGGGGRGDEPPKDPSKKISAGLSKYHNLTSEELSARQRVVALELDRVLNDSGNVGSTISRVASIIPRKGYTNIQGGGEPISKAKTLNELMKDLDEITIAPAYKNIESGKAGIGSRMTPAQTLQVLIRGERPNAESYQHFSQQIGHGKLGSVNYFKRHALQTTIVGGAALFVAGSTLSGVSYLNNPEPGYSTAQRWPFLTYFAPETWGNDRQQAVDLSVWALQDNPGLFDNPNTEWSKYLTALKDNNVPAQVQSKLSADQKEAVRIVKIEIDRDAQKAEAERLEQTQATADKQNQTIQKSLELQRTEMLQGLGQQSADNVVSQARVQSEAAKSTAPSVKEAFETAHALFQDITKDDSLGIKGKGKVIDDAWLASVNENKLQITKFEEELKSRGINQAAIPQIVDYAKAAAQP